MEHYKVMMQKNVELRVLKIDWMVTTEWVRHGTPLSRKDAQYWCDGYNTFWANSDDSKRCYISQC